VVANHSTLLRIYFIIGGNHATLAGHDILCGIQTKTTSTKAAYRLPIVSCSNCLSSIFNDYQIVTFCDVHDGEHIAGVTIKVNGHDCACVLCYGFFNQAWINIKSLRINIHKNGTCTCIENTADGCHKGEWGCNDLVTGSNIMSKKCNMQSSCS